MKPIPVFMRRIRAARTMFGVSGMEVRVFCARGRVLRGWFEGIWMGEDAQGLAVACGRGGGLGGGCAADLTLRILS